jgi:hypothetical protein
VLKAGECIMKTFLIVKRKISPSNQPGTAAGSEYKLLQPPETMNSGPERMQDIIPMLTPT